MPFACSICEQESLKICAFCTKDACDNHLCPRCGCCSDCCECEVPLDDVAVHEVHHAGPSEHATAPEPVAPPEPEAVFPEPPAQFETSVPVPDEPPSEPSGTPEI